MEIKVQMIKRMSVIAVLFLGCSYLITVNKELHFLVLNSPWISNDFALVISSGIFVSIIVLVLGELVEFNKERIKMLNWLYWQGFYLYVELFLVKENLHEYELNTEMVVHPDLLDMRKDRIMIQVRAIYCQEYYSFDVKDMFLNVYNDFCQITHQNIIRWAENTVYYKIAANELHIAIEAGKEIEEKKLNFLKVVKIQQDDIEEIMKFVDEYMKILDKEIHKKNGRWKNDKKKITTSYVPLHAAGAFCDYLNRYAKFL